MAESTREDQLQSIFNKKIGLDMKLRRELGGISIRALCREIDADCAASICRLENGKANWTTRMKARVVAALERLGA